MRWLSVAVLIFSSLALRAQTNAPASAASPPPKGVESAALSILTPAQQVEYAQAHEKALTSNPSLQQEGERLKKKFADVMEHGTAAQKQAVLEKVDAHRMKLRQAMLKIDPALAPVFAQIDKHISESKAKGADK